MTAEHSFLLWIHYTLRTKEQAVFLCDVGGSVGWWEWADGGGKSSAGSVFVSVWGRGRK